MVFTKHSHTLFFCLALMMGVMPLIGFAGSASASLGDEAALAAQSGLPPVAEMRDGQLVALTSEDNLKAIIEESLLGQSDAQFFARMEKVWFEKIGEFHYLRGRGGNQDGKIVNIAMKLLAAGHGSYRPIPIFKACLPVGETCPRNGCLMTDYGGGNVDCGCVPAGECAMTPIIIIIPFLSEF